MKNLHSLKESIPEQVLQAAANLLNDYPTMDLKWENEKLSYRFKGEKRFATTKIEGWSGPYYKKRDTTEALVNLTRNST